MSAVAGEQVDIGIDLDAEVPCVGVYVDLECPNTAGFLATLTHQRCSVGSRSAALCARCTGELKRFVRRRMVDCRSCGYVLTPEDVRVQPL